ncbi:MAG TPA: lysophospholipase [Candidatus Dormibacteraeota bacterium]|nr:lysophospholipase [Candidatus Dormibacteraeota bacterium]
MAESKLITEGTVESADGTELAYRAWPSPRAGITFAVVHGLGEHSGRYDRFAGGMAKHGMSTYALDLRGHGKSPGQRGHVDSWSQWTDDVSAFVRHVESTTDAEVVPLGHSFGGATLLSTVIAGKLPTTRRFVVSSPALKLKLSVAGWKLTLGPIASKILPRLALANEIDASTVSRIPEVVEAYRNDPLVHNKISTRLGAEWQDATRTILADAGQIKIPFLILAGTADALIDPAGSQELHDKARSMSELHLLEGRYHEPFNDLRSEEVFQLIAGWLSKSTSKR